MFRPPRVTPRPRSAHSLAALFSSTLPTECTTVPSSAPLQGGERESVGRGQAVQGSGTPIFWSFIVLIFNARVIVGDCESSSSPRHNESGGSPQLQSRPVGGKGKRPLSASASQPHTPRPSPAQRTVGSGE